MEHHYHESFATNCLPHLLHKSFTPSAEQLELAKQSLIERRKLANGIQQLLFCRSGKNMEDLLVSVSEKTMIENERRKYIDFVRRNYDEKIMEELMSVGKLRARIKEFETKN
jgi:hypothetical protein